MWMISYLSSMRVLIVEAIAEIGAEKLRPIKDALPEEVDYFAIKAVMFKHNLIAAE